MITRDLAVLTLSEIANSGIISEKLKDLLNEIITCIEAERNRLNDPPKMVYRSTSYVTMEEYINIQWMRASIMMLWQK